MGCDLARGSLQALRPRTRSQRQAIDQGHFGRLLRTRQEPLSQALFLSRARRVDASCHENVGIHDSVTTWPLETRLRSVKQHGVFEQPEAYERYIGRWSRRLAPEFISWLDVAAGSRWLDVGCGTGAFSTTILEQADPRSVVGVDPSRSFVDHARSAVRDPRASFAVGNAMSLDLPSGEFDVAAATLVLNFVPDPVTAIKEMRRVVTGGGTVGATVWDYAEGMRLLRIFWDAAAELDPASSALDEGRRFSICNPDGLRDCFKRAGLANIEVRPLVVEMVFSGFDDYWTPFLGGQGPAGAYTMSLPESDRVRLADLIRSHLQPGPDGSIRMTSRAWAVRGS